MASSLRAEEGEVWTDSDVTNASPCRSEHVTNTSPCRSKNGSPDRRGTDVVVREKKKKSSRYSELSKRFSVIENMLQKMMEAKSDTSKSVPTDKSKKKLSQRQFNTIYTDSESDQDDNVSLHAGKDFDTENVSDSDIEGKAKSLSAEQQKCLFDMFGDDAVVKKNEKKEGLILDKSQVEVIEGSYRCKQPNYLSAFSEENYDLFPVDSDSEKYLEVPSLDDLVETSLVKRYGNKASFTKKGKGLYSQPAKMVEKIAFKGQQSARLGLVMQMYMQQSLGNLLQFLDSSDFDKSKAMQQVKDIFAMSTKCLDQVGRSGAFHHIIRRSLTMTDTAFYEQPDSLEFTNLPLTGDGVFGSGLETLLKSRKEKRKQLEDLIPEVHKKDLKRKFQGSAQPESFKRPTLSRQDENSKWNNFRIPKVQRDSRDSNYSGRRYSYHSSRGSYGSYPRRHPTSSRGRLGKADDK